MALGVRRPASLIPDYSLTGDVLSYARCGLQYRLYKVGNLPATRPVQLWFGQFLHGVLEEAFRRFSDSRTIPNDTESINQVCDLVSRRLAATGLRARNQQLEETANWRADVLLRELAPHLFPLINLAEVRLTSTRPLGDPALPSHYQMTGIVDVITNVELGRADWEPNPLVAAIQDHISPGLAGTFEVIVDYKGSRRPPTTVVGNQVDFSKIYDRQVLTYAQLRGRQIGSRPVVGALLLYLNEFAPTWDDVQQMRHELSLGRTEVGPLPDSDDAAEAARSRPPKGSRPALSLDLRLRRALRVVPVTQASMDAAVSEFDTYARAIERNRAHERDSGSVLGAWRNYSTDEATCAACDFRHACPEPAGNP